MMLPMLAFGRKFYISSSTGSDSYTATQAQNQNTPWRSLIKVEQWANIPGNAQPGDTFAFKRGDVFTNGYSWYSSFHWMNYAPEGYQMPSGTQANPIVLTNYGTGELPNFLYPATTIATNSSRNVIELGGVSWIVIDGLQFNDYRFAYADKINPAYTRGAILMGTNVSNTWSDTTVLARKIKDCVVKNCYFNNVSFAIMSLAGIRCKITNNTVVNMKTCPDTSGTYDVGAGAFEAINGLYNEISYNYVKGAWAKSGRVSSTFGLLGVGVDIFNLKHSKIIYNTFIDCSGAWEIGNIDQVDTTAGAQNDTFAYNKVINCGQFGYIHGAAGDPFMGRVKNIRCFNNIVINNNSSRMSGPNFGYDLYNDGQSFNGNGLGQYKWWFFRSPLKCPNNALPISDTTWSNPINPPYCNYSGHRLAVQYSTDNFVGNPDTIVDFRNNIFYATTGDQMIYNASRTKQFHSNNIYYVKGSFLNPTTLGGTLNTSPGKVEQQRSSAIFVDTTSIYPENWNLRIASGADFAVTGGTSVGFSKDFDGNTIYGTPTIGLYQYSTTPPCTFSYGAWSNCVGGTQTRPYVTSPLGCTGTPPTDSITRSCSVTPCSFTYSAWSNCINNVQTRTYTSSPNGCIGTPPADSLTRTCTTPACTFTYGTWTTCTNGKQTRVAYPSPTGCYGTPPADSITRTCSSVIITYFYYNSSRKSIYIKANVSGTVSIYNSVGQLVQSSSYPANGKWISVSGLPTGSYVATTYNKSITFRR